MGGGATTGALLAGDLGLPPRTLKHTSLEGACPGQKGTSVTTLEDADLEE